MSKDESVNVDTEAAADVSYKEIVGIVNSLTEKLVELGTFQENMATKMSEMGTQQENLAAKTIVSEEKGYDIGTSEAYQTNLKMFLDEHLGKNLDASKRSQSFFDQITQNGIVMTQLIQSSLVSTLDLIAKQAVAHRDIAIDSEWKPKPKPKDPTETK